MLCIYATYPPPGIAILAASNLISKFLFLFFYFRSGSVTFVLEQ